MRYFFVLGTSKRTNYINPEMIELASSMNTSQYPLLMKNSAFGLPSHPAKFKYTGTKNPNQRTNANDIAVPAPEVLKYAL